MLTTVKDRLKTLFDQGFVQRDTIPTRRSRAPYYYTLTQKGMHYLEQADFDTSEAFRASKEINKSSLFIDHTLEVNDVLIAAALLQRSNPNYRLDSFIHERTLKQNPYKATWKVKKGGEHQKEQKESFTLIPDAFLDFRFYPTEGKPQRLSILLEHDRGTEGQKKFRQRIRAYVVFLKSGAYQELFATKGITIAFTTFVGTYRLEQMREWTRQELGTTNEPTSTGRKFWFTAMTKPVDPKYLWLESCWYPPYEEGQQPVPLLA
jgi:hypothetical protein